MAGLDPAIHREKVFAKKMDRRVKPGGDDYLPGCFSEAGGIRLLLASQ
jgi:hypothetical protein